MTPKTMIKEVTITDIPECVTMIRASFLTVADEFGFTCENALRFTAFATTNERLAHQMTEEHRPMYAYHENAQIIGYYSLALQENHECELNNLCVLPEYRHRRIGEKLLNDAYEKAQALGCVKINIGIVEENVMLRNWYEKMGFQHTSTRKYDFFPFTYGYMEMKF